MKIKEALKRSYRSRHVSVINDCLKHEDGLSYKNLYNEYCKRCEKEEIEPVCRTSLHSIIREYEERGIVIRETLHGDRYTKRRYSKRVWLIK